MHPSTHRLAPLRLVVTALPLTARGLFFLALSAAVLAAGIARADMAGMFWGSSFFLACLYALVAGHLTRLAVLRTRRRPGFLEIHLPSTVPSPAETSEALLKVLLPRAFMPGFTVRFRLDLRWHERTIDGIRSPLSAGKNALTVHFRPPGRGRFQADEARFEIRDILGLTSSAVSMPVSENVKVFPRLWRESRPLRLLEEGGEAALHAGRKRRSEELLEVRKYFPGDDRRKLNWKVFAHVNELFLRIGEETPPPQSRLLFILDPSANPLVPAAIKADYLDGLVEAYASAMTALLGSGREIQAVWPAAGQSRAYSQESERELMAALSDVWWAEPGWAMELPARSGMHAVVFSTPGSPSLGGIMGELGARGWKASLFLKDIDPVPVKARGKRPSDFIFLPKAPKAGPVPGEKSLRPFRDALAEARARYSGALVDGVSAGRGDHGRDEQA